MKKIILLIFLSFCAIGFGQDKSQNRAIEVKVQNITQANTEKQPEVYSNNSETSVDEKNSSVITGKRNANLAIPNNGTLNDNMRPEEILYTSGSYFNTPGTPNLSVVQLPNTTYGYTSNDRIAENFVLTSDATITSMDFFAYQPNATVCTIDRVYIVIYHGYLPLQQTIGVDLVYGDWSTNRFSSVEFAGANRVTQTTTTNTDRKIQRVTANTPGLTLPAGEYWVEFSFLSSSGPLPYYPFVSNPGATATGDALSFLFSTYRWINVYDFGSGARQGFPIVIYGNEVIGGLFPDPYCGPLPFAAVVPITLVDVAGINNVSGNAVNNSPAHEDFTAIFGNMVEGMTYSIALEGNTNGNSNSTFTVFIDWNQDGILDNEGERYEIGAITNSTGTDGQQAIGNITVPTGVVSGPTRMRVIKRYSYSILPPTYATDSCNPGAGGGQAEDYTIVVATLIFPSPYCGPLTFNANTEPITLVDVAGINNISGAAVDSSPAHEDFTSIIGNMVEGMTYPIALEGNTAGDYTNRFTVFIDWNQDGTLDNESERYEIGSITNSTGTDGQQAVGNILVPIGVVPGPTRMRVIKTFTSQTTPVYATDSCTPGTNSLGYGQAEDYTIEVGIFFPAPYCGPIIFDVDVAPITLVDVAGISNVSNAAVNGTAHEDFTSIIGNMEESMSYPITLKGNTYGIWTNSFTVFIDWNQDGVLDNAGERYEIGTIANSTGIDEKQAIGNILVPTGVLGGITRMRVIKIFTGSLNPHYSLDSCTPDSDTGQAEDYTIVVTPSLGIRDNALAGFSYFPNPTTGSLTLNSINTIDNAELFNVLGQKLLEVKINATTSTLKISELAAGTYILKVSVEGEIGTYKIIKD